MPISVYWTTVNDSGDCNSDGTRHWRRKRGMVGRVPRSEKVREWMSLKCENEVTQIRYLFRFLGYFVAGLRSQSRSRSRSESVVFPGVGVGVGQNLPTPTDSGQALISDSQKEPCRLFKVFFYAYFFVMDWLDDKYRTLSCAVLHAEMTIGQNSWLRPNPAPMSEMCAVGLDSFWSLDTTIWTVALAISWAPALGVGTTGRSNNFFHWSNPIAKRVQLCYGGSRHPTRSGPSRIQVGSGHLHPAIATTTAY